MLRNVQYYTHTHLEALSKKRKTRDFQEIENKGGLVYLASNPAISYEAVRREWE